MIRTITLTKTIIQNYFNMNNYTSYNNNNYNNYNNNEIIKIITIIMISLCLREKNIWRLIDDIVHF